MRTRYRYDADLDAVVEIRPNSNYFEERPQGPAVISDSLNGIHGLKNHADGKTYDGKRAFEKATRAAGCVTVGNEDMSRYVHRPELIGKREIGEAIKRGFDEVRQFGPDAAKRARILGER
jgi:hypothetical protein